MRAGLRAPPRRIEQPLRRVDVQIVRDIEDVDDERAVDGVGPRCRSR